MADYTTARVRIWGESVGALAESETGRVTFEYDPAFRGAGLEISPLRLPLRLSGPQEFPELARSPTFQGLPGVFSDSLPDAFGNELIRRYFQDRGRSDVGSPIQRLLYVGDRGPGALTYEPGMATARGNEEALEIRGLVDQARRIIEGEPGGAIAEIIRVGATAGGARPKALVLWDRIRSRIRSGHAAPDPGEEPWIIKFDGVTRDSSGQTNRPAGAPAPWGRVEYAYSRMAAAAGIRMTETHLLMDGEYAHFMTRRFDREGPEGGTRLHLHSLGGLLHLDYLNQYQIGYEDYFDAIRGLGLPQPAVEEGFRRMVFHLATVNYDDHLKNFAFLMDASGTWSLAPAFDVAFAENDQWTRQHQMSVNGKFREVTRNDVLQVGTTFDLPRGGAHILDEVLDAVGGWREAAEPTGLHPDEVDWFELRLDRAMRPLRATRS